MDIIVSSRELKGTIHLPPSKSEVIRVLILNALIGIRPCALIDSHKQYCDDIIAAANAVEKAFFDKGTFTEPIPVGASATLIRILAPILLFKDGSARFSCDASLMRRDMKSLEKVLNCNVSYDHSDNIISFSGGRLNGEYYTVYAKKSSQFASGMLIASAIKGFKVRVITLVSAPYIELTLECLKSFGCSFKRFANGYFSPVGKLNAPECYSVRPDYSYAANFIAADLIKGGGKRIRFEDDDESTAMEEAAIVDLMSRIKVDVANCPDLFPILAVNALKRRESTFIIGTGRLRDKESDRVASVNALITALGVRMDEYVDSVMIYGCGGELYGGTVESFGDHRIVMAAAIASLMCSEPVVIKGAESISKSAPCFFDDFRLLGGSADELVRK